MTDCLDFHGKKWYLRDKSDWEELKRSHVEDVLLDLGVGEDQCEAFIQHFIYRDNDAHARRYADVERAQLRLGI